MTEAKPYSYQMVGRVKKEIDIDYYMLDDKTLGFKMHGKQDQNHD